MTEKGKPQSNMKLLMLWRTSGFIRNKKGPQQFPGSQSLQIAATPARRNWCVVLALLIRPCSGLAWCRWYLKKLESPPRCGGNPRQRRRLCELHPLTDDAAPLLEALQHFPADALWCVVNSRTENLGGDFAFLTRGDGLQKWNRGGAIADVFDVGAAEIFEMNCERVEIDIGGDGPMREIEFQQFSSAGQVGQWNVNLLVEAAGRRTAGSSCQGTLVAPMNRMGLSFFFCRSLPCLAESAGRRAA